MRCPNCGCGIEQTDSLFGTTVAAPAGPDRRAEGNGMPRRTGRSALPKDWLPTAEQEKYCRQQGKVVSDCLVAFKEYYLAKGTVWKDWGLVWMKWCREWQPRKSEKGTAAPTLFADEPWDARCRGYAKTGFWMPLQWGPKPGAEGSRVPSQFLEEFRK